MKCIFLRDDRMIVFQCDGVDIGWDMMGISCYIFIYIYIHVFRSMSCAMMCWLVPNLWWLNRCSGARMGLTGGT